MCTFSPFLRTFSSPINMLDPIWSGSAGKHIGQKQAGWFLHTGLLLYRIHLAKTWHNQPELMQILAGFAQYYPGCLWKNGTESESRKLVAGWLRPARNWAWWFMHTSSLPDQMHLAKPWPGHPDRIWVSFAQYGRCLFEKNGAEMDARNRIRRILSGPILAARWLQWP